MFFIFETEVSWNLLNLELSWTAFDGWLFTQSLVVQSLNVFIRKVKKKKKKGVRKVQFVLLYVLVVSVA